MFENDDKEKMQITIIGHDITLKPSIKNLTGAKYDDVIERINQSILNGEDGGNFDSFDIEYQWEMTNCQASQICTVIVYAVFGGIDNIESFTSKIDASKYFLDWANKNNGENLAFDDVSEGLEWFRSNEEQLDYTIDFLEHELNQ